MRQVFQLWDNVNGLMGDLRVVDVPDGGRGRAHEFR